MCKKLRIKSIPALLSDNEVINEVINNKLTFRKEGSKLSITSDEVIKVCKKDCGEDIKIEEGEKVVVLYLDGEDVIRLERWMLEEYCDCEIKCATCKC